MISDHLTHSTAAVHTFQKALLQFLGENIPFTIRKVVSFTDGCKAQYKKCKNFANLASQGRRNEEDFGMLLGAYDGIGGTLKREATRYSLRQPSISSDQEERKKIQTQIQQS